MKLGPSLRPFLWLGCIALLGCTTWTERREEDLRVLEGRRLSGAEGVLRVKIPLTSADKSLLLQVKPQLGFFSYVTHVEDGEGNILRDFAEDIQRSRQATGGAYASDLTLLNYPVAGEDEFLSGEELVVAVTAVDSNSEPSTGVKLELQALLKADSEWEKGELYVNLYFAGTTAQDEHVQSAVDSAVTIWTELVAGAGVVLSVEKKEWLEGALPKPGYGAPGEFEGLSAESKIRTVNVVIVPSIYGSESLLGASGGIPGPLVSTSHSAVVISASANAGPDLDYSEQEIQLLGETMAHEVGHYLGLFHPVEGTWDKWDALGDTEDCDDQQVCEDELGSNIMFPYPVCDEQSCELQDTLTTEQQSVIHRYTGLW